jgi:hypothetical protein
MRAAAIAGVIAACTALAAAQPAGPLVPALTAEQIQASQALAPTYDRAAAMEQARQATFKDRPLGAIVQKSFNAFSNFLIVSAQMMPEPGYAFRPTPDVRTFGEQSTMRPGPTMASVIRPASRLASSGARRRASRPSPRKRRS